MTWQKRARLGVAIFGIVVAGVVFFAIGEREKPVAAPAPERFDPASVVETTGCVLQRVTGSKQDFTITCDRQLTYENGATKLLGVRIAVHERAGRNFVITGREAQAGDRQRELQLTGEVKLASDDGFEITADRATFSERDGVVRAPGAIDFKKGSAMSGSGVGMSYDKNSDVLTIADQARVTFTDASGAPTAQFSAGAATLARQDNYLRLERAVHAVRGEQTINADKATATLTDDESAITFIELRGAASVAGGSGAFESMIARDIDLDYTDDGQTIERVMLSGAGAIALRGQGAAAGRRMLGESLALAVAPDGAVTSATGRGNVQLDLPARDGAAPRQIRAQALDATGEAGKGLTAARFIENVEYREDAATRNAPRIARSRALNVSLDGDAISNAVFSGGVTFDEQALTAAAAEATYDPNTGALELTGGHPRVADDRIAVDANAIDLTLQGRRIVATGAVKTVLQGSAATPGLLKKEQPVHVSAAALQYEGEPGRAVYTGSAQLWQGDTAIRGDRITIDEQKGNLDAKGSARSTLALGNSTSVGRAEEIRYEDKTRQIAFVGISPPLAVAGSRPPAKPAPSVPAQLSGPQGDLKANRIVVVLAKEESRVERLEGYADVDLRVDTRVATGARLTYHAADERYVMTGTPAVPVTVVEACRETTGRTLTFFKSADRIVVDGNEEIRTRTKSGGPCPETRSR